MGQKDGCVTEHTVAMWLWPVVHLSETWSSLLGFPFYKTSCFLFLRVALNNEWDGLPWAPRKMAFDEFLLSCCSLPPQTTADHFCQLCLKCIFCTAFMKKGMTSRHSHYSIFYKNMLNSLYFLYYFSMKERRLVKGHREWIAKYLEMESEPKDNEKEFWSQPTRNFWLLVKCKWLNISNIDTINHTYDNWVK